jgi:hypothetical protein
MPFSNFQSTATLEQVDAAKATIKLEESIAKFIQQSQVVEQSNKHLSYLIAILSVIQTVSAVIVLLK